MIKQATVQAYNNSGKFDKLVNQFREHNKVSDIDTHAFALNDGIMYIAIISYNVFEPVKPHPVTGTNTPKNIKSVAFNAVKKQTLTKI